jgi:glycosyltransferase involved in cell wall biosynthesis
MTCTVAARPIHVLFIMTSAGVGGAETLTISLLNGLDPTRFKLSLAYLKQEHDLLKKIDRKRVNGNVFCCDVEGGLDWAAARRLATCMEDGAVDIVVCTNFYPLLYGWMARWLSRRTPHIVEVFHSTHLGSLKEKLQMLLYRPLLRFSRMLVYVCENQRRHWRARLLAAREDVVIHNGVDTERFQNHYTGAETALFRAAHGLGPGDYVVGLCACMRPEKAHGDLLRALARARGNGVDIKCLLIGDGPERGAIEACIDSMELRDHVAVTGLVADVRLALAACDVLAITSHSETFSIAALESMAMGKPIVMTDVGGASEQVVHDENGYLYERGNIDELADKLGRLADSGRRRQMGQRACVTVTEKFSLGAMVEAYERLFVRLARPEAATSGVPARGSSHG